jgi:Holliday junction resolvase-like predicted endonuclease
MSRRSRARVSEKAMQLATEHLEERGYKVLDTFPKEPPVDLVAEHDGLLVFSTIRSLPEASRPADYATERQRVDVRKAAARWLAAHPGVASDRALRFDSIAITINETGRLVRFAHVEGLY